MNTKIVTVKDEEILREYKYEITESLYRGCKCYGISIKRTDYLNEIIVKEVKESVELVTPDLERATQFVDMLSEKNVSPFHLIDIISEYEDKFIDDFNKLDKVINVN